MNYTQLLCTVIVFNLIIQEGCVCEGQDYHANKFIRSNSNFCLKLNAHFICQDLIHIVGRGTVHTC